MHRVWPYPPQQVGGRGAISAGPAKEQILAAVRQQVEYYFSVENLCKDLFLRQRMDAEGWIPLPVIAGFNRIRMMTPEPAVVLEAIQGSAVVEVEAVGGADGHRLRKMSDWQSWVMSASERSGMAAMAAAGAATAPAPPAGGAPKPPPSGLPPIKSMEELTAEFVKVNHGGDGSGGGAQARDGSPACRPLARVEGCGQGWGHRGRV